MWSLCTWYPCVAIQKDKDQFWLKFSNTEIRKKITWFLDGFVHITYESVDGKEIILEGVLSISRVLCPFVATEMLGEGHRPSPGGFSSISVLIRRFSEVLAYFLLWAKLAINLVIFCQMPELILKTNNLLKPCFVGVWCDMDILGYCTYTVAIVVCTIYVKSIYMISLCCNSKR